METFHFFHGDKAECLVTRPSPSASEAATAKTFSEAERARGAVTKRIKQSIEKIADAIPALGHHLTARIKTGYFRSYNPHPDRPMVWKF